jgi:hypothetical protein
VTGDYGFLHTFSLRKRRCGGEADSIGLKPLKSMILSERSQPTTGFLVLGDGVDKVDYPLYLEIILT